MKSKKKPKAPKSEPSARFFWVLFALLVAVNFILSYASFTLEQKLWIFILGEVIPLLYWLQQESLRKSPPLPFEQQEFFGPTTLWVFSLSLGAVLLSRFWKIDSLFCWPLGDEGLNGAAAVQLSRHWDWKFFYTSGQAPPLPVWATASLLKLGFPPLLGLWAPSALASILTVAAGYSAARQFFSRSFSILLGGLLAFSFWPLWIGRYCHQGVWVPLWTFGCLYFFGRWLKSEPERSGREAFILGLVTGLGSFTFTPWPSVALAVGWAVFFTSFHKKKWSSIGSFAGGSFLTLIPFLWAVLHEGYGGHLKEVSGLGQTPWARQFEVILGYGSVLGWGIFRHDGFYVPQWGGFLNPVLTALFCLGILTIIRNRTSSFSRWMLPAGLLLSLPGFLSSNVEGFRIAQLLPWVLLAAAWGFQPLMESIPANRRFLAAGAIFFLSFVFDWGRLTLPYFDVAGNPQMFLSTSRSLDRYRAYRVAQEAAAGNGPGMVFSEWDLPADRTLDFATSRFNTVTNPSLKPDQAQWLALVSDAHYRPFLAKRFPQGRWVSLDSDFSLDGNRDLWVVPLTAENRLLFLRWAAADKAFRDINWGIDHIHDRDCLERVDKSIREDYPLIQGDRYLESCFWEKTGQFYYYAQNHFAEHLRASELALKNGLPASHLYAKRAELLLLSGDKRAAGLALEKAKDSERLYPWRKN